MNRAELFVNDRVGAGGCRLDVHTVTVYRGLNLFGLCVVNVEIDRAVAVGEEVDAVAHPHRSRIVRILAWHFLDGGIGKVGNPDRRSCAAAVVLQPAIKHRYLREVREWYKG